MRPQVAVSSCLLGQAVRYDGTDKHQAWLTEVLSQSMDLLPLCPEMAIGLGVPRPAIHLRQIGGKILLLGKDDHSADFTQQMVDHAKRVVDQLASVSGYIFKSKSPSCGIDDVKLLDGQSGELSQPVAGIYNAIIRARLPRLPVIDERGLKNDVERDKFLRRVNEYASVNFS